MKFINIITPPPSYNRAIKLNYLTSILAILATSSVATISHATVQLTVTPHLELNVKPFNNVGGTKFQVSATNTQYVITKNQADIEEKPTETGIFDQVQYVGPYNSITGKVGAKASYKINDQLLAKATLNYTVEEDVDGSFSLIQKDLLSLKLAFNQEFTQYTDTTGINHYLLGTTAYNNNEDQNRLDLTIKNADLNFKTDQLLEVSTADTKPLVFSLGTGKITTDSKNNETFYKLGFKGDYSDFTATFDFIKTVKKVFLENTAISRFNLDVWQPKANPAKQITPLPSSTNYSTQYNEVKNGYLTSLNYKFNSQLDVFIAYSNVRSNLNNLSFYKKKEQENHKLIATSKIKRETKAIGFKYQYDPKLNIHGGIAFEKLSYKVSAEVGYQDTATKKDYPFYTDYRTISSTIYNVGADYKLNKNITLLVDGSKTNIKYNTEGYTLTNNTRTKLYINKITSNRDRKLFQVSSGVKISF